MINRAKKVFLLKGFLIMFILFITSGCVYNGSLFKQNRVYYSPEQITTEYDEEGVNFTIRTNYWHGSPKNLTRYTLPIYISVENRTNTPIVIQREDIVLLDGFRNQYNSLAPDDVANIVISSRRSGYTRIYPSISIGLGSYYHHGGYYHGYRYYHPFYRHHLFYDDYPYYNYPRAYYRPDYRDIYTDAFQPGKIMPDAKLSGFVYFKKLPGMTEEIILQVNYRSQDSNEFRSLEFHFDIMKEG